MEISRSYVTRVNNKRFLISSYILMVKKSVSLDEDDKTLLEAATGHGQSYMAKIRLKGNSVSLEKSA